MIRPLALLALLAPAPALAQEFGVTGEGQEPLPDFSLQVDELIDQQIIVESLDAGTVQSIPLTPFRPREAPIVRVSEAQVAILRGLDKISGEVRDMELRPGETADIGRLTVELAECRVPVDNPSGDAYAFLTIRAQGLDTPAFSGWMIASSPALSALEHPRYDVWVIRCRSV